jgi:Fur family ferric uptake transcriptional regulator
MTSPMEKADASGAELQRRNTRQRDAIQQAIATAGQPLLPHEILAIAQTAHPSLGIATVYRNLKMLVDSGDVQPVELPGEAARYEHAHQDHHHHFRCNTCQQVFDVHGCPGHLNRFAPKGFEVERHELTLYGTCAACVAAR